jgi:hypothetical protein
VTGAAATRTGAACRRRRGLRAISWGRRDLGELGEEDEDVRLYSTGHQSRLVAPI